MDSYERFVRVMEFEDPDRTPIFDSIDNDYILREIGGKGPPREVVPKAFKKLGIDASARRISMVLCILLGSLERNGFQELRK